jgi:hypothetical protein
MPEEADSRPASEQIDATIANLDDWRGETFAAVRALVHAAVPEVVEEIKYRKPTNPHGVPVFSHHGTLCTGEIYKDKVKLTFASGASLDDPEGLFNSSLGGNRRRAIDIFEKDALEERSFRDLVRAAADFNEP